jgi:phage gpG-like protein
MNNNNTPQFDRIISRYKELMRNAPNMVGIIALQLFDESFSKQGQIMSGGSVKKWKVRGPHPQNRTGAALLIDKGVLRRELNYKTSANKVILSSNLPYSKLQNDGGTIPVTPKMRKFFWAMFKRTGDETWKWFALMKKNTITIAARPFLYDTPELPKRLDDHFIPLIKSIINNS